MSCTPKNFLHRLKKHKEDALEYIVDEYFAWVKATVSNVLLPLGQSGAVEECINDVFLAIWNHIGSFQGDETDFKKWVYKVAKFQAIDYYRQLTRHQMDELPEELPLQEASAEEQLLKKAERQEVVELLQTLPILDQQIFAMKYFLEMRSEVIAELLGVSRSVVDNHVFRGKKKLRQQAFKIELEEI